MRGAKNIYIYITNIYLANGSHQAKIKISDTEFHALRNHQELLQGFICDCINLWFRVSLYTLRGGFRSLAVMAAVKECSGKF